jgi:hypothetical protein
MSEKYSTGKIVDFLERCNYAMYSDYYVEAINRLRAADKFAEDVKHEIEVTDDERIAGRFRKAVIEYGGGNE